MIVAAAMDEKGIRSTMCSCGDDTRRIKPKTFHMFYLVSVLGNICQQIFFTFSVPNLERIFFSVMLSVYKDFKKQRIRNLKKNSSLFSVQKKDTA